ncbi:MAG TPA: DegT/DnrJ/EryC1/StrS family aminotransferase, partial [Terriglobia bacterium]|nr:DegT/DnrJ/EryC1/StrS family aminotransferase [Terriglobia bacterium]
LGATPVLVDVLEDSWCLDPERVERAITSRTRAIIAVHLYGNLADLDALNDIARRHNLFLIEDAAEALGSEYQGRKAGASSLFSVFSFHGTKVMTTGEGGMFATNDPELCRRVEQLNNHGRAAGDMRQFWPSALGYKFKMSNIQAALGCAQLERIDELVARKREIFFRYRDALLPGIPGAAMNPEPAGVLNSFWMPTLVLPPEQRGRRDGILHSMQAAGIDSRVFFPPLSDTPVFRDFPRADTPRAHDLHERALNLPTYHDLTPADQERVIDAAMEVVRQ